jgi:hypothetical protein
MVTVTTRPFRFIAESSHGRVVPVEGALVYPGAAGRYRLTSGRPSSAHRVWKLPSPSVRR